jgi:hypothetical protein
MIESIRQKFLLAAPHLILKKANFLPAKIRNKRVVFALAVPVHLSTLSSSPCNKIRKKKKRPQDRAGKLNFGCLSAAGTQINL